MKYSISVQREKDEKEMLFIIIIIFFLFAVVCSLLFFSLVEKRQIIVLNQEGIHFKGFWFGGMPKYCSWDEISKIHLKDGDGVMFEKSTLVFICRSGKQFRLPIVWRFWPLLVVVANPGGYYYVSIDHSISIVAAIEQFFDLVESFPVK